MCDRLDRSLDIGLDDDLEFFLFIAFGSTEQIVERHFLGGRATFQLRDAFFLLQCFRKRLCVAITRHRLKFFSGTRDVGQAQNLHGRRGTGNTDLLSLIADQGFDAAPVL